MVWGFTRIYKRHEISVQKALTQMLIMKIDYAKIYLIVYFIIYTTL